MKKLTLLLAAALMVTGGAFAQDKACCKKSAHCTKGCCKDKKSCTKDGSKATSSTKTETAKPKA